MSRRNSISQTGGGKAKDKILAEFREKITTIEQLTDISKCIALVKQAGTTKEKKAINNLI